MHDSPNSQESVAGLYDRLDRLDELLEDMIELEVASRAELEIAIERLNQRIDALEADESST